jgi:hypothetical protein
VNSFRPDQVVVIQDEHKITRRSRQVIDQSGQYRFEWVGLRRMQHRQGRLPGPWTNPLDGGDDVVPQADRVVVPFIQGDPGGGLGRLARGNPLGKDRGLTESGRSRDQNQTVVAEIPQVLHQARPRNQPRS